MPVCTLRSTDYFHYDPIGDKVSGEGYDKANLLGNDEWNTDKNDEGAPPQSSSGSDITKTLNTTLKHLNLTNSSGSLRTVLSELKLFLFLCLFLDILDPLKTYLVDRIFWTICLSKHWLLLPQQLGNPN